MSKKIYFDMDGTIYNLYGISNWLDRIEADDMTIFNEPGIMPNYRAVYNCVQDLIRLGWEVGIITWAPKGVSSKSSTFTRCKEAKRRWIDKAFPELQCDFHILEYGTPKMTAIEITEADEVAILVDDNPVVRQDWNNSWFNAMTIDASMDGWENELGGLRG